jgi:hypothetical protein
MGVISDFLAAGDTINVASGHVGIDRAVCQELADWVTTYGDYSMPTGFGVATEAQSIAIYSGTVSGGTFTLTVTLRSGETFTTAAIAYNANAATIETAIDVAATAAAVVGWTNADISVAGGILTTTPVTLTFDGASVISLNHALTVVDGTELTGGGAAGAVSVTTNGQTARVPWAILKVTGAIGGTPPVQGTSSAVTAGSGPTNALRLSQGTIRALAREAAFDDRNAAVEADILRALNLS